MTRSFDPDSLALAACHFIGGGAVAGAHGTATPGKERTDTITEAVLTAL